MIENKVKKPALIVKIEKILPDMSRAEQTVAEYIMQHPEMVIDLSIAALAENVGVSEPTVVRACRRLGFRGYQSLKITLAQDIVKPLESVYEDVSPNDSVQTIVNKVFSGSMKTLRMTCETIKWEEIDIAANMLKNAKTIYIFGMGGSGSIAMDLQHKMMRLGLNVIAYTDAHLQAIGAAYAGKGDVVFAVSHSGSTKTIVDNTRRAKENGSGVISLTSLGSSPLSKLADVSLYTVSPETKYRIVALSSRLAGLAIIDSIYNCIAIHSDSVQSMKVEKAMEELKY